MALACIRYHIISRLFNMLFYLNVLRIIRNTFSDAKLH